MMENKHEFTDTNHDMSIIHKRNFGQTLNTLEQIEIYLAQKNTPSMNLNETTSENTLFRILHNKQNFPLPSALHRRST